MERGILSAELQPFSVRLLSYAQGVVDHMDSFQSLANWLARSASASSVMPMHQGIFLMNENVKILRGLGENWVSYNGLKFCRFEVKLQVMWIIGASCRDFFVSVHLQCHPDRPYPEMCRNFWTVTETIQSLKFKTKFSIHEIGNSTQKRS